MRANPAPIAEPVEIQIRKTTERTITVHLKPNRLFMELLPLQMAGTQSAFFAIEYRPQQSKSRNFYIPFNDRKA
jgi:hypothetical protein